MPGKSRRVLSLLLVCLMVVTLFAGCGKKNSNSTKAANSTSDGTVKNATTEKMVLFYSYANGSTPEGIAAEKKAMEDKLKDNVNITLDWVIVPRDNFEEKLNTMLAAGEQIDAAVGDLDDLDTASAKSGLVMPLNDLLDKYGKHLKALIPQEAWDAVTDYKGDITAIPAYNKNYWQGAVIRKDWLDKLNLPVPKTLDQIEATMVAFKAMDKNIIPASGESWYMEPLLASAVNGGITPNIEWDMLDPTGEKVINGFTHPQYKKFLELYKKWLDNGWFNKDFLATDDAKNDQMFEQGKVGILFTDPHNAVNYQSVLQKTDPNAKVTFLPVPDGPGGKAAFALNNGVDKIVWINQNSAHPERVVQYFDWMVSNKDNYTLARLGIEGQDWIKDGDKWVLPPDADGDTTKRAYFDIFAPLTYQSLEKKRVDEPAIYDEIKKAYESVPVIQPSLKGFHANYDAIGDVNTLDIWGEMYNIAVGARPQSDYEKLCDDYAKSGGDKIYGGLTKQYQAWKAKQK